MRKNIIAGNWKMHFSSEETKKFLNELVPKVSDTKCEVKSVEDARDALKKAQEQNDINEMKAKKDELTKLIQDMSVKLNVQPTESTFQFILLSQVW